MRTAFCLTALMLLGPLSVASAQPPAVDLKDPAAVAAAYAQACRDADGDAALALVAPDDPARPMLAEMLKQMQGEMARNGYAPRDMMLEFQFLPIGMQTEREVVGTTPDGERMRVKIRASVVSDLNFVLVKQADGTWRVNFSESVKASTSSGKSMLVMERQTGGGGGGAEGPAHFVSENHLRALYQAAEEYTQDHQGKLPPADRWVDELEPYVLDRDQFHCPALVGVEYGYAMSDEASGATLGNDWQARGAMLLFFEWPEGGRNAHAAAEALAGLKSPWADGALAVVDGRGQARLLPAGVSLTEAAQDEAARDRCSNHLSQLVAAARKFAREHNGILPGADTWQNDLAPYLLGGEDVAEVLRCPAAPELDFGYAINREIAGKNVFELKDPTQLVLFFESDLNVPNASGIPAQDASPAGRHLGWGGGLERVNHVGYLSGSVSQEAQPGPPGGAAAVPAE
jgi:hypothetical protein